MVYNLKGAGEEINLNTLIIIFFLSLSILFGSYFVFHVIPPFLMGSNLINPFTVNNILLSVNEFVLDSFEFESCPDCTKSYSFEKDDYFVFEYYIPYKNKISLFFRKILHQIYGVPDHGWVSIDFEPSNTDWGEYSSINFFVRSTEEPGELDFVIQEADGDVWHFSDERILKTKRLALVSIPFENLILSQESLGDGKKDFHNITIFQLVVTSPNQAVNNTLYFTLKNNSLFYLF